MDYKNIAVFASGNGTNFSAIARAVKSGNIKARLALLVCDNPAAFVIQRAQKAGVQVALVRRGEYASKADFERAICRCLEANKIDFLVLAGFMRLFSPEFVRQFKGRIVNIHPSLLPAFKGTEGIRDAFAYGVKVTGVTVHFVDEELDHGPIIVQAAVPVKENDTPETLEARIHKIEHTLYPKAIDLCVRGKVRLEGRRARLL